MGPLNRALWGVIKFLKVTGECRSVLLCTTYLPLTTSVGVGVIKGFLKAFQARIFLPPTFLGNLQPRSSSRGLGVLHPVKTKLQNISSHDDLASLPGVTPFIFFSPQSPWSGKHGGKIRVSRSHLYMSSPSTESHIWSHVFDHLVIRSHPLFAAMEQRIFIM